MTVCKHLALCYVLYIPDKYLQCSLDVKRMRTIAHGHTRVEVQINFSVNTDEGPVHSVWKVPAQGSFPRNFARPWSKSQQREVGCGTL